MALNTGVPILLGNPRSPVSRKVWDLVSRFADLDDVNVNRRTMKWSA
ncbi:MAG: hypothetical protein GWM91_04480 [Actinobacteria bacterium]|nr:hypothetical protein [Actinomycetota bacterium]NIV54876.1 hypothetical protein [Actinomycetota bacterium]NIX49727.1 hypothetical protein [Actinomycetota bacterium]